jgi:hypothetical protein
MILALPDRIPAAKPGAFVNRCREPFFCIFFYGTARMALGETCPPWRVLPSFDHPTYTHSS